jgi:hypothetical protein
MPNLCVVPVACRYVFSSHSNPEAFVSFGKPIEGLAMQSAVSGVVCALELAVTRVLDDLSGDLARQNTEEFLTVLRGCHDFRYHVLKLSGGPDLPLKTWGA